MREFSEKKNNGNIIYSGAGDSLSCTIGSIDRIMAKKANKSVAPDLFLKMLQANFKGLDIVKEFKFHPTRRWRFDYAFPFLMIAVEVDGGVWTGGRHINPAGYINDMEKLNTAASMGWLVLRITTDDRFASKTFDLIKKAVEYRIMES